MASTDIIDPFKTEKKSVDIVDPFKKEEKSDIPKPSSEKEKKPSLSERGGDILKETGIGAAAGYFAPEIMSYGVAPIAAAFPLTAPYAPAVYSAGQALRASRGLSALSSGIGGAVGETLGQVSDIAGRPKYQSELARIVGGSFGAEPFRLMGTTAGRAGSIIANKFVFGSGTIARSIGQLLQDGGIKTESLTKAQREFYLKKLDDIRGGQESIVAQKELFEMIEKSAQDVTTKSKAQALLLDNEAMRVESQAASLSDYIKSQYEQQAKEIEAAGTKGGGDALLSAQKQANDIITRGEQESKRILSDARTKILALREKRRDLINSIPRIESEGKASLVEMGEPKLLTETGLAIRDKIAPVFETLKKTRSDNAEVNKKEIFNFAFLKEKQGKKINQTEQFDLLNKEINDSLTSRETGLANVTVEELERSLRKVKDSVNGRVIKAVKGVGGAPDIPERLQPASFESLEVLRRFLRDRSYGLPAEGYDAIGQQQAGKLATRIEDIMEEFAPGFRKSFLDKYKLDSEPLRQYKAKLGRAIVDKEEFDMGRFATDPKNIGSKAFSSQQSVNDLIALMGGDKKAVEDIAKGYILDKLRNASAADVIKIVNELREPLSLFPQLQGQLEAVAARLSSSMQLSGRRSTLAKSLRTEAMGLPEKERARAAATEAEALTKAAPLRTSGLTAQQKIESDAAKEAKRLRDEGVSSAETQTEGLLSEAKESRLKSKEAISEGQKKVDILLTGKEPAKRIEQLILGNNKEEWDAIAPIIKSDPKGTEILSQVITQVIARQAAGSLKSAISTMINLSDTLVERNLMSKDVADKLIKDLQEVFVAPSDLKVKIPYAQRLIKDAITGYAIPRFVNKSFKEEEK